MSRIRTSLIALLILSGGIVGAWKLRPHPGNSEPASHAATQRGRSFRVEPPTSRSFERSAVLLDIDADTSQGGNAQAGPKFGQADPVAPRLVASPPPPSVPDADRLAQIRRRIDQLPIPRLASRYDQAARPVAASSSESTPAGPDGAKRHRTNETARTRRLTPIPDPQDAWQHSPEGQTGRGPTEGGSPSPETASTLAGPAQAGEGEEMDESAGEALAPLRPPAARWHVIRDGDTVPRLAQQYLGSPERAPELVRANPEILADPQLLPIGARIRIPN